MNPMDEIRLQLFQISLLFRKSQFIRDAYWRGEKGQKLLLTWVTHIKTKWRFSSILVHYFKSLNLIKANNNNNDSSKVPKKDSVRREDFPIEDV